MSYHRDYNTVHNGKGDMTVYSYRGANIHNDRGDNIIHNDKSDYYHQS